MLKNLLSTPTAQLGKASRFAVFQIKLWSHCARLLKKNRSGQQAAALSYHTIFGIVPLAIVMLLIFQSFPASSEISEKFRNMIYRELNLSSIEYAPNKDLPEEKIGLTENIDNLIDKFFTGTNKGTVTLFSVLIVVFAALALLSTIERAFNNIWHVGRPRSFIHRTINYWALLTLGPLLIGVGFYVTTKYAALGKLQENIFGQVAPVVSSYITAVVAFFLLYFVLPNTKIRAKAAIWGAAVAALVWIVAKSVFSNYVTGWKPYSTVYGAMALIPITVLWIYITWLIILFGLQLTFTTQHLTSLDAAEIGAARKTEDYFIANDLTVINIIREIAAAFEHDDAPVALEVISSKLNIPAEFTEKILNHLIASELIIKTSEPKVGFIPARSTENIRLDQIAEAVKKFSFTQAPTQQNRQLEQIDQLRQNILAQYNLKQLTGDEQNT